MLVLYRINFTLRRFTWAWKEFKKVLFKILVFRSRTLWIVDLAVQKGFSHGMCQWTKSDTPNHTLGISVSSFILVCRFSSRVSHLFPVCVCRLLSVLEFQWTSFTMTSQKWVSATHTYNERLEEKARVRGVQFIKKNPRALMEKLGEIEPKISKRLLTKNFKCLSYPPFLMQRD